MDWRRLGNQRREALTILRGGWVNHPASKMWQGYFYQLANYGLAICDEWAYRGYRDKTCRGDIVVEQKKHCNKELPPWFGDPKFHLAHQSNLIRKKPEHYAILFPDIPDDLPYIWPC